MQTVSITDYTLLTPKLAKVVIAYTGKFNKESLRAAITEKFEAKAAPVEDSFREVRAGVWRRWVCYNSLLGRTQMAMPVTK
jgi:hypothetical protein